MNLQYKILERYSPLSEVKVGKYYAVKPFRFGGQLVGGICRYIHENAYHLIYFPNGMSGVDANLLPRFEITNEFNDIGALDHYVRTQVLNK